MAGLMAPSPSTSCRRHVANPARAPVARTLRQCYPFEDKKKEWRVKKESRIKSDKIYFSQTIKIEGRFT
jgi:hypothetical protein